MLINLSLWWTSHFRIIFLNRSPKSIQHRQIDRPTKIDSEFEGSFSLSHHKIVTEPCMATRIDHIRPTCQHVIVPHQHRIGVGPC